MRDTSSAYARAGKPVSMPGPEDDLAGVDPTLVHNGAFLRRVLEASGDCIKVLDLDGRLVFMSAGGMQVMEIDDFGPFAGCPWLDFWKGEKYADAREAVALAKAGGLGRFQGWCATAKGTAKWWDVQVTPISGPDGRPQQLLSISRDITDFKRAEERQRLLVGELHHRVKNLLTVVQAVASQTLRDGAGSLQTARQNLAARIVALSDAHDLLTRDAGDSAAITEIVAGVLAPHADAARRRVEGPELTLTGRQARGLTLALHELATNAVKYGALSNESGYLDVRWRVERDSEEHGAETGTRQLVLTWTERGGPVPVIPVARKGFGSRLIEHSVADFGGRVQVAYEPAGLLCTIAAPFGDT